MQADDKLYYIALSRIPFIGKVGFKALLSYAGSPQAVLNMPPGKMLKIPGVGQKLVNAFKERGDVLKEAEAELKAAEDLGIKLLTFLEKDYPKRLNQLMDAPPVLYTSGAADFNSPRMISIVGTRQATDYGKEVTDQIIADLASYQPTIISGLAYGIDIQAHKAALAHQLPTIGVLANSLDTIYPTQHKSIATQMLEKGGLISEFQLFSKLDPRQFPQRNRIISGLSDALIVVEAAEKGGALITANIAHSYNKEVFAVPGGLDRKYSAGCNALIKEMKASIYTDAHQVAQALGWDLEDNTSARPLKATLDLSAFSENEQKVIQHLSDSGSDLHIDTLSWQVQLPISQVASILLNLEFQGLIKALPGKKYKLLLK